MQRIFLSLLLSILYFPLILADDEKYLLPEDPFSSSLVKTQNLLSTIVNSVSAISGEWIHSETDFVILGPEPLTLSRMYTGDHAHNDRLGYNWDFNRPHKLVIDFEEKGTKHVRAKARLHHSSGIATIHESSPNQEKVLETSVPLSLNRSQGLTNCRGEISARTNLHNTVIHLNWKKKQCKAITGSGHLTHYEFSHLQDLATWKEGNIGVGYYKEHALHHYRPIYEKKPNGNEIQFKQGYICATNSSQSQTFGEVFFKSEGVETLKIEASDGKIGSYHFDIYDHPVYTNHGQLKGFFKKRFYLKKAHFTHKPSEYYEYIHHPPTRPTENIKNPMLKTKRKPNGRFQEVEYYNKGSNRIDMCTDRGKSHRDIQIDHEHDFRNHRVKVVKEPVGHNEQPIITHRFIYELAPDDHSPKKKNSEFSGKTKVYDAYLNKTVYVYNKEHRPTRIQRYDRKNRLYSEECFSWDDRYSYPPNLFQLNRDSTIQGAKATQSFIYPQIAREKISEDGAGDLIKSCLKSQVIQTGGHGNLMGKYVKDDKGHILYAHFFEYDKKGNITDDYLLGNLRGVEEPPIILNAHEKPILEIGECYHKKFTYTQDRFHLLKSEEEDNGKKIVYKYHPGSDLISAKYIKENQNIRLRQFFHYDENGTLVKVIKDDGSEKNEESFADVTERMISYTTPRKTMPLGLPETIEHRYLDQSTQTEKLLKKIHFHYSREGHLEQQDHYDADGKYCYSLYWEYDPHGNVTREVNAMGHEVIKEYDENDNLIVERGPRPGDKKIYTYDFVNRLIGVEAQEEEQTWTLSHKYDLIGNRIATIDRYGNETTYVYDEFQRLVKTLYPITQNGRSVKKTEYDCLDRSICETDARGFSTKKTYNARGKPTSILHPDGQIERFEYNLDGTLAKSIASNGTEIHYLYDFLERLLEEKTVSQKGEVLCRICHAYNSFHKISTTDAEGVVTDFTYDGAGRVIKISCLDKIEIFEYDSLGRCSKKIEYYGDEKQKVTCTEHDFLDQVIEERIEDENGLILKRVQYAYDCLGNRTLVTEETETGPSTHITYYNGDKKPILMIDPEGNETHVTYEQIKNSLDQWILQIKTTDPLGRQTIITHDSREQPINIQKKDIHGVLLANQNLDYDGNGLVIRLVDSLIVNGEIKKDISTKIAYSSMKQIIELTQAEGLPEQQITYTKYNGYGQKEQEIKPNGVILSFTYDALGRLKTLSSNDRTIDDLYHYNLRNQITQIENRIQKTQSHLNYDKRGRLDKETLANGLSVEYTYDSLDRVIQLNLPENNQVSYIYDSLYLRQVERLQNRQTLYLYQYDLYDLSGLLLNASTIDHQKSQFRYDRCKRHVSVDSPGCRQHHMEYDEGGRLRKYTLEDDAGILHRQFSFDDLDHLIQENGNTYRCDSLHNRLTKNQIPHYSNGLHQLIDNGEHIFKYDLAGNLKSKQNKYSRVKYHYDALNRLISIKTDNETIDYQYDSFNRRISKKRNGETTRYLYVGQDDIGAIDEKGKIQELRILGQGHGAEIGATVAIELQGQIFAPSHDFQGNIISIRNLSGECVETYRYSAFGETTITNGQRETLKISQIGNPWQFSSKRIDEESGLIYFGRRYYDPVNGQWITSDPAGLADGPNLYAYLHHHPTLGFDLYGLEEEPYYPLQNVDFDDRRSPEHHKTDIPPSQDTPIGVVEKKKGKKDWMFFCGTNQIGDIGISWMNGIMNSLKDSSVTAKALSEMADDHFVTFVYNRSNGFIGDLVRSFVELYFYVQTDRVRQLQTRWDSYFNNVESDGQLLHVCHSEGAIITRNALMTYPEELRNRIIILAIAPGAYIDDKYARQITHYRSTHDIVPLFDFVGAYKCRNSTVVLKPHPNASWFDHSVNSPTYQKQLRYEVDKYMDKFTSLACA